MVEQFFQALTPYLQWLAIVGFVMALASMLVIPWLIVKMPVDYFVRPRRPRHWTPWTMLWWLLRNLLAVVLFVAGFLMLFLPGQGLLTLLIAVVVSDLPGKYWLEQRIIRQHSILKAINWIRARYHRLPILTPD